jgi:hypothetical protein
MDRNALQRQLRAQVQRLLERSDDLPDAALQEVNDYLKRFLLYPDPVERALHFAPWDDEPDTEEERRASKDANEEWLRGEARSLEDVRRELGL